MVAFSAPGSGTGAEGYALPLPAVPVDEPAWWSAVRRAFPDSAGEREEVWDRGAYTVRAVYDSLVESVRLSVRDSTGTVFQLGAVTSPVHRIYWLDDPPMTAVERSALGRAFDEAALYDESARTVRTRDAAPTPARLARFRGAGPSPLRLARLP